MNRYTFMSKVQTDMLFSIGIKSPKHSYKGNVITSKPEIYGKSRGLSPNEKILFSKNGMIILKRTDDETL